MKSAFVELTARKLTLPNLSFGNDSTPTDVGARKNKKTNYPTPGTWDLKPINLLYRVKDVLPKLHIIRLFRRPVDGNDDYTNPLSWLKGDLKEGESKSTFLSTVNASLTRHGFKIQRIEAYEAEIPNNFDQSIQSRVEFGRNLTKAWESLGKPVFVMVQLPEKDIPIYASLKWWGDCEKGVRTVCVTSKKLEKCGQDQNMMSNFAYV